MHPPSCAPSCSLCKAPEPKYDLTPASRDDAGQANRQPASGVLLIPWRAGTSSLRVAASGYRCTASAVTQIQGVARKARALGLPPMAKPDGGQGHEHHGDGGAVEPGPAPAPLGSEPPRDHEGRRDEDDGAGPT